MIKGSTIFGAVLVGATLAPSAAQAQTRGGFEAGVEVFDYSYREIVDGETIVSDDGKFAGFNLGYVETIGGGLFLRAKLSGSAGSIDYRSTSVDGDERLDGVGHTIAQLELQIGADLSIGGGATLSPFTGLSSRAVFDESGGKVTPSGRVGYDRETSYAYIPFGLGLRVPAGAGGSSVIASAQYNLVVNGTSKSLFSEIDPEFEDLKLDLNGGHGFQASVAYQMPIGKRALSFGPFIRHWKLNQSESFVITNPDDPTESIEFFEPRSRTTELGLRVSFAF